eukprot:JP436852.1.p1 GENE.JP436852.1~~JP436852.1.p1  ORF type:complete len:68 (+),score=0.80 JP436852.1:454-657(+)
MVHDTSHRSTKNIAMATLCLSRKKTTVIAMATTYVSRKKTLDFAMARHVSQGPLKEDSDDQVPPLSE